MPNIVVYKPTKVFDLVSGKESPIGEDIDPEVGSVTFEAEWIGHPNQEIGGRFLQITGTTKGGAEGYWKKLDASMAKVEED